MKLPKTSKQRPPPSELPEADRLELLGAAHRHVRQHVTGLQHLRRPVADKARDHRLALEARSEALDVAAVGRVDERGRRFVSCGALHYAKPI